MGSAQKMKVLLLNQIPDVNNKYTFSLAKALIKQNVDISVGLLEGDNLSEYSGVPVFSGFCRFTSEKGSLNKVLKYLKGWKGVYSFCHDNHIKIVHIQWLIFSPVDRLYQKKLKKNGISVVNTVHDILPLNEKFYDRPFHRLIYRNSDMVISQATDNIKRLADDFGVSKEKIVYIPHGHYMDYAEVIEKLEARAHLGISTDKTVILFFGQIKKVKGLDVLIKAMKAVTQKHRKVLCLIAGKVWKDDLHSYEELISNLSLSDYFKLDIRYIEDSEIKYYFGASDMVAVPYLKVYQSGVSLLAYAYKKPVIATTLGEFINTIQDKKTGLLVPPGDPEALSEAINWFIENPESAREFGARGYEDLSKRLSWDVIGEKTKAVYSALKEQ